MQPTIGQTPLLLRLLDRQQGRDEQDGNRVCRNDITPDTDAIQGTQ